MMAPLIVWVVLTGIPPKTDTKSVVAPALSAEKPATDLSLVNRVVTHRVRNSPARSQINNGNSSTIRRDQKAESRKPSGGQICRLAVRLVYTPTGQLATMGPGTY